MVLLPVLGVSIILSHNRFMSSKSDGQGAIPGVDMAEDSRNCPNYDEVSTRDQG